MKKSLPCPLTDEETIAFGAKLITALGAQEDLELKLAGFKLAHKREAEAAAFHTHQLREIVATRTEWRDIEVTEHTDYKRGVVDAFRTDTGAKIGTRALTEEERQSPLFREEHSERVDGSTKSEKSLGKKRRKSTTEDEKPVQA